jgi:hypothetical protein
LGHGFVVVIAVSQRWGSHSVAQADLELLGSSEPLILASQELKLQEHATMHGYRLFIFVHSGSEDQTQGFLHARQVLQSLSFKLYQSLSFTCPI